MFCVFFFFFKQKTAYEMSASLVGSEMCIRDDYQGIYIKKMLDKSKGRKALEKEKRKKG